MLKKSSKRLYLFFTFLILIIAALGMAIATGWDSSKASHSTLYADTIRAKEDPTHYVTIEDSLEVNPYCGMGSCNTAIAASSGGAGVAVDASHGIGTEAQLATNSYGVYGEETSSENFGYIGDEEYAIYGEHGLTGNYGFVGGTEVGVYGKNADTANFAYLGGPTKAVFARHTNSGKTAYLAGSEVAVYGSVLNNIQGYSAIFDGGQGVQIKNGGLCVAPDDAGCDPDRDGKGKVIAVSFNSLSVDIAEKFATEESLEAGDVVVIDASKKESIKKSTEAYDSLVAGIVSSNPGVILGEEGTPMALSGRVPTKVSAENGPIEVGDLLTTSSTPGHAMKCKDRFECSGVMLGKALEPLEEGTGKIVVLVTLA